MKGFLSRLLRLGAGGGEGVLAGDICRLFGADWFLRPGGAGVPATEAYERCCCTGVEVLVAALCYSTWVVVVVGWLVVG